MSNPLVSVIIPNYNHARYLDERINSVLNQTYENFEVIILDDYSTDNGASKNFIEKYRNNRHISHIIYNKTNGGSPYKQWQKGANLANGELLWIAESDDSCDEHLLEELVPYFSDKSVTVAFCRSVMFNENGKIGMAGPTNIKEGVSDGKQFIHDQLIIGTGIVNASSVVFRKETYMNISDEYTTFKGSGDHLFWILMAENGKVAFVEKPYNYFRTHSNNTTKRLTGNGLNQIEDKRIYDYLCRKNLIPQNERRYYLKETMRINVFQLHTDKAIQQKIYKAWNFGKWQQVELRLESYVRRLRLLFRI